VKCAKEGHFIPDKALSCPDCAKERDQQALQDAQLEFLRRTVRGDFNYTLRVIKDRDRHVLMYTSYKRTFCGQHLESKPPYIEYEPYNADTLSKVCAGCRVAIASMVREIEAQ
jgi:hypothetical protein